MADVAYRAQAVGDHEMAHGYGPNVHIMAQPYLLTQLATLCGPAARQPLINSLIENCYRALLVHVFDREFPRCAVAAPTRMAEVHPNGVYRGAVIDPATRVVTVNIARAGTFPSHICFHMLNEFLDPGGIRQDHIVMDRLTDSEGRVTGAGIHGTKIGGDVDGRLVLFPDPMGATGSSLIRAINHYKHELRGSPRKIINVHLIVTPNYVRAMREAHPDVVIYAIRVDRGTSDPDVLSSMPGQHWDREDGLNERHYIVPGGGGFGEVLNNSYV
ncbi:MAG: uracil phosphoribosyltransferase [Planctomycetes bacterium]|nr:uracil phosphoribosyltransferase [Planctomycetota bacterium]